MSAWDCSHTRGARSCLECAVLEATDPRRTSFPQLQRFLTDPEPCLENIATLSSVFDRQDAMTRLAKLNIFKISLRLFQLKQYLNVQHFVQDEGLQLSVGLLARSDDAVDNNDLKQLVSVLLLAQQQDFSH